MGKYSAYTAAFKLKVISYAEEHGIRAAGRQFCIAEFNVRYWSRQKDALGRARMTSKAFRGPKTGRYPQIERDLLAYVKWMRNCAGVTTDMLLSKAREISRRHGVDAAHFKVSRGWLSGFMKRHGLTLRRGQFSGLEEDGDVQTAVVGGPAVDGRLRLSGEPQGRMLVMETEQHIKEESSSATKGAAPIKSTLSSSHEAEEAELEAAIVEEEEEVGEEDVEEQVEEVVEDEDDEVLLGGEEEEKLLAAGSEEEEEEEGINLPDEDLEACVVKEVVADESGPSPPSLSASELVAEIEEEVEEEEDGVVGYEEGDCARTEEDLLKEDEEGSSMLVEVAVGRGSVEGKVVGKEGVADGEKDVVVEKEEKESVVQAEAKDSDGVGSEDHGGVGRTKDGVKDGSPLKVAGQLEGKESPEDLCEVKSNGQPKETLANSKVKKEPKEATESTPKSASILGFKGTAVSGDQEDTPPAATVKIEPQEEMEEGTSKQSRVMKGEVDSSNPASDDYEEEGHEDGAEETPEEGSHGEKRSCLGDSGGISSEESGDMCRKRRRVETSTDVGGGVSDGARGGSYHRNDGRGQGGGGEESKECVLTGDSEKEGGGGSDDGLDRKMERLKKEIHILGVMAKQKELEWDEIIRAKKTKEENLIRLRRKRRIAAISREAALAERRRHRREGRRARTEADLSSEEEGTDEEWYMQIRGMTAAALPGSRAHAGVGTSLRPSGGRMPNRNIPGNQGSPVMGLNSSTLPHSTIGQSMPISTSSVPSIVSTTYIQRMHRPILPKPPTIPGGPVNRRNAAVQQSSPVPVTTSIANPLIPATVPSNGGLSGNGCSSLDGSQNNNQVIGEGRQGPILDVRSIIADYRSRHPETVPLRGRRNKSLTPSPAAASSLRESGSTGSDGGPSENPLSTDVGMSTVTSTPGILNIASLALGSGSQVRTRGVQAQDGGAPDISYLLLSAGNGCHPGGTLPIRHQPPPRESSRPSSTESSRSGGQAIPPVSLPGGGALGDNAGNFSFKDVLVQFARMSQTEQQQQMMAVIPGMGGQGLMPSAPVAVPPQVSLPSRQPRHILPSTTTTSVLPGPLVTPARPPPPPYPEVTLLPVLVAGNEGNPSVRPTMPPEVAAPQPRSALPPPTPSLLQMSLSAPTSTPKAPSPPTTSLLHGILTKSGTGVASSSGLGSSSSSGPSPRATAFAPTLARLLTAPEKQPSVRPTPPATSGSSVLGSQAFVSIGELLQTSKAKNEITITPVSGAQPSLLKQQPQQPLQPIANLPTKEEPAAHMEEQDDSTDRLVIDESIAASEGDGRRQSRQRQAPMASATAMAQEGQQEGMADEEEVEEEEVAMEEEEGDGMDEEEGDGMDEEDEGEEGPVPECQGCHSRAAQFVCAGCGNQWYCSRDCQVSAWDEHSEVCSG
ncbi:uncharacterized protein LOC124158816 isoform X2 [Ischnura elegans]|uniref:uncharacterized protein LOC124158816 isoform X2 n=1 Tax=Ischnura elegans TaxID=197161 RepID=UPI001ED8B659|nr:uncharacterized protein LOC124158816 isoform X2 [Ischnura elegans]